MFQPDSMNMKKSEKTVLIPRLSSNLAISWWLVANLCMFWSHVGNAQEIPAAFVCSGVSEEVLLGKRPWAGHPIDPGSCICASDEATVSEGAPVTLICLPGEQFPPELQFGSNCGAKPHRLVK